MTRNQTRTAREHRERYNTLSRYYDVLVDPFQGRLRRRGIDSLDVTSDDRVLDVGCGTGRGLATLQKSVGPDGEFVGIDIAEHMCQLTRSHLEVDVSSAVVCGDALTLPFHSASFDAVLVSFTLELFADDRQQVVLEEIHRVLVPGGRICVVAPSTASDFIAPLYEQLNDVLPRLVDSRPLDVSVVLARAGFEDIRIRTERALVVPVELAFARRGPSAEDRF